MTEINNSIQENTLFDYVSDLKLIILRKKNSHE